MKTALVHDYLLVRRGAERSFLEMTRTWPGASILTLVYDPAGLGPDLLDRDVRTSYLQHLPVTQANFRRLLPLFARATDSLDLTEFELVVSSSSAFAHGVRAREDATHVCYCHTPFRYAWYEEERALTEVRAPLRGLLRRTLRTKRAWDIQAAQRVTHFVANAEITRGRIRRYFGRDATVVHPPVELERFAPGEPEDFFLYVGELTRHKQIDVALQAAQSIGHRIKIVGSGPDEARLRATYGDVAEFAGRLDDDQLADLYARCLALVVPSVEEFGITAVEAQASGRPVLAVDAGGARETVLPGETGVLVEPGDADAMARAMSRTDWDALDPDDMVRNAQRFSRETFARRMREEVERAQETRVAFAA